MTHFQHVNQQHQQHVSQHQQHLQQKRKMYTARLEISTVLGI